MNIYGVHLTKDYVHSYQSEGEASLRGEREKESTRPKEGAFLFSRGLRRSRCLQLCEQVLHQKLLDG